MEIHKHTYKRRVYVNILNNVFLMRLITDGSQNNFQNLQNDDSSIPGNKTRYIFQLSGLE